MAEKKENLANATAGVCYQVKIGASPATSRVNYTTGAFIFPFEKIQAFLSDKPMTRPAKTRPAKMPPD